MIKKKVCSFELAFGNFTFTWYSQLLMQGTEAIITLKKQTQSVSKIAKIQQFGGFFERRNALANSARSEIPQKTTELHEDFFQLLEYSLEMLS